jgi:UDP-N-acetylglucosamine:LPS N-acetylglucosamine transferase
VLVKDSDAATKLVPEILRLCADTHTLQQMQQSVSRAARPEATAAIVNEVEKIWKH